MTDQPVGGMESPGDFYDEAPCGYMTTTPDGVIVSANRVFLEWLDMPLEGLVGKRFFDLLDVGARMFHQTHFVPLLSIRGQVKEIAFDLQLADGGTLPIVVSAAVKRGTGGTPERHHIVAFDASQRRRYERELLAARRQSEEASRRLASVLESTTDGVIVVSRDWTIQFINQNASTMVAPGRDLTGTNFWDAFPHCVGTLFEENYRLAMQENRPVTFENFHPYFKIWVDVRAVPANDGSLSIFFRDVSAERAMDEQRARAQEMVRAHAAEMERFAHLASHDLQEPLRKIAAFADMLRVSLAEHDADGVERSLAVMIKAAQRGRTLVEDILRYARSREQSVEARPVELRALVRDVLQQFEDSIAGASGVVRLEIPDVVASCDAPLIAQVFQNLISNAVKYRRPDVPLVIDISAVADAADGHLAISFEDNGIGFDPSLADRMFAPFQRLVTKEQYTGSGIGLSLARSILDKHGWSVSAIGEPGKGARFTIHVPAESLVGPKAA